MPIHKLDSLSIEELNKKYKIVSGNLEILKEYGTHGGKYDTVKEAKYALVYMDSPLLEACNIVDLPGYGANEDDDVERAREGGKVADILVYTSNSTGFLDAEDFARMQYEVSRLPVFEGTVEDYPLLGNLFIVATHASREKTREDLVRILSTASKRLYETMSETWEALSKARGCTIDADILRSRMFTYWAEIPERRKELESSITGYLAKTLPEAKYGMLDRTVAEYKSGADTYLSARIAQYQSMMADIKNAERSYEELIKNEPTRKARIKKATQNIVQKIQTYHKNNLEELSNVYQELMTTDKLEKLIKARYEKKEQAQRYLGTFILDQMQGRLARFGEEKSKLLSHEIDEFLQIYTLAFSNATKDIEDPSLSIPFDAKGAFLAGFTGLSTLGALALWVSTLGNLGGFIAAAKLASLLTTWGIPIGSKTLIVWLAAIGGPTVVGIAIALAVGSLMWAIFGDSWQTRLAKKTIDAFKAKKVREKLSENITKYWNDTDTAFHEGAKSVEQKFIKSLADLKAIVKGSVSKEKLEAQMTEYKAVRDFLGNIPWVPLAR